jgi:hypothetical protein
MFVSIGRIWAGRPAAKVGIGEPRERTWPWSGLAHRLTRTRERGPVVPVALGASDGELVRMATPPAMDMAEHHRHRAMMLLLTNPGRPGR